MIVDGFDGGEGEKDHGLADCLTSEEVGYAGTEGVETEAFDWVIVQGAIGVGDVESVVAGVECCYSGRLG
jgi:hypothetical protein